MQQQEGWLNLATLLTMLTLKVECTGRTRNDIELAIEQIHGKIREGYNSGFDGNDDTGSYSFELSGEEEEQ